MAPPAAFYCVSSALYFPGAVAMINSLRFAGHSEPVFVLDGGLSRAQRELLAPEATVVEPPAGREPFTLKAYAPLERPAEIMVLIDADMIVTRSLAPLIATAAEGRVVAFRNPSDRFVAEWGRLLDLGEMRRQPYVCSGLVAMARAPGEEVLRLLADRQGRVDFERSYFGDGDQAYPLVFADQDVLNAILASRVPPDRVVALDSELAPMPPFDGLRLVDEQRLRCVNADASEPYVVHHSLPSKPWLGAAVEGVYTRLLRRMLTGPDVAIRLPRGAIPLALRRGPLAYAERRRVWASQQLRWRVGGLLGERRGAAGSGGAG